MNHRVILLILGLATVVAAGEARAQTGPAIVIPTRPGIPVIINGVDASYAIVEGDWGLARPGHMAVTVIGGLPFLPNRAYAPRYPYHPRYGAPPPRGRFEIEPPADRALPPEAETYSRSWSNSDQVPAAPVNRTMAHPPGGELSPTIVDPQTFQQPMIVAPTPRNRR
jgi:hypothetical protein